jgi:hypothetical protein
MVGAIGKIQGTGGMRGTLFFLGRKEKKKCIMGRIDVD